MIDFYFQYFLINYCTKQVILNLEKHRKSNMHRKRVSQRKSELKFFTEDYCQDLAVNSDPVVGYLLTIMEWEASLDVQTNSILHKIFKNELQTMKCLIKLQLKHELNNCQEKEARILNHVSNYHKLNQLFSNCLILNKKYSEVYAELEKFRQYKEKKEDKLVEDMMKYLNDQVIFETIFHSYLEAYNVNIFTAELIDYLSTQYEVNLLIVDENQGQKNIWINKDHEQLCSQSINFQRLNQINKKYEAISCNLKTGLISLVSTLGTKIKKDNNGKIKEGEISEKFEHLQNMLKKIRKKTSRASKNKCQIILSKEPKNNFEILNVFEINNKIQSQIGNKAFLQQIFFDAKIREEISGDQQFTFMKQKIVKIQTLTFFDQILKSLNVLSFIYNQLDLEKPNNYQYEFKSLSQLIQSQFLCEQFVSSKQASKCHDQLICINDDQDPCLTPGCDLKIKALYPSAVNSFYKFVSILLRIKVPSQNYLLSIVKAQAIYMKNIQQAIVSLYNMVKGKQIICYSLIREFIKILLKESNCWKNSASYSDAGHLLLLLEEQSQKAGIISQIIYQLDQNYQIKEPLRKLIQISSENLTYNRGQKSLKLYRCILEEIIKVKNGLKLDHHYSLNQIHRTFSLIPESDNNQESQSSKSKYFQQIVIEVCEASQNSIFLPNLFFFFNLQLRFKLAIFKLQLYWSEKKDLIFEKKIQAFKDFINLNCAPIFRLVSKTHRFIDILEKNNEIEAFIEELQKEVACFHLTGKITAIINNINPQIPDLHEHINRLNYQSLIQLNKLFLFFNPLENKNVQILKFTHKLKNNIQTFSRIKFEQMGDDSPIKILQKARLAQIIYVVHYLSGNLLQNTFINLCKLYRSQDINLNLYEIKQRQCIKQQYNQYFKGDDLDLVSDFYERIILIAIQQVIAELNCENLDDHHKLRELSLLFRFHQLFISLNEIKQIDYWKNKAAIKTKYHQIYQLMFFFTNFENQLNNQSQKEDKMASTKHKCRILNYIYILTEISSITRIKLHKKIQDLQFKIIDREPLYKNPLKYLKETQKYLYHSFCQILSRKVKEIDLHSNINIQFNKAQSPSVYFSKLKKIMLQLVNSECNFNNNSNYGAKQEVELFGEFKAFQIALLDCDFEKSERNTITRQKKMAISPFCFEKQSQTLKKIKYKVNIDILKRTLQTRKKISELQMSEKRMKDDINWQTQKLKHNVIQKINQFIVMSNVDQQQSYINFKHTVNLQTIKGIENVIEEQTQMYMKKTEQYPQNLFLTDCEECDDEQENSNKNSRLLDINIKAIMSNMKKIKIFWAWKQLLKKTNVKDKEWMVFNINVRNILNNSQVIKSLRETKITRKNFLYEDVACQIIKEDNLRVNQKIQQLKLDNLGKKVNEYRDKLIFK